MMAQRFLILGPSNTAVSSHPLRVSPGQKVFSPSVKPNVNSVFLNLN